MVFAKENHGQTLIEVLVALVVAVAVITAITAAVADSLNNATFTRNQNLASFYAQQGMEIVRAIRDRSWAEFTSLAGNPNRCLPEGSSLPTPRIGSDCDGEGNVGIIFIRGITLDDNSLDCGGPPPQNTKITVSVKWSDGKCPTSPSQARFCHEVKLISCFTKINVVPIP